MHDDATLTQRTWVERIIRPIRGSARRKVRMREELLSHLLAVMEGGASFDEACRRLGNPEELRRQFQASIPAGERLLYRQIFPAEWNIMRGGDRRQPGESVPHHAARLSLLMFVFVHACAIPVYTFALVKTFQLHDWAPMTKILLFGEPLYLALALMVFGAALFIHLLRSRPGAVALLAASAGIALWVFSVLFATGSLAESNGLCLFFDPDQRLLLGGMAFLAPFILVLIARQMDLERRLSARWTGLQLD